VTLGTQRRFSNCAADYIPKRAVGVPISKAMVNFISMIRGFDEPVNA
jgi:hypothetical protein